MIHGFNSLNKARAEVLTKDSIVITKVTLGDSGTKSVSASNYTNLDFNISELVSSANEVIGVQSYRLAKSDYTEADGLTITETEITTLNGQLYYRMRVFNPTGSAIVLSRAQTSIHLVTIA